MKRFTLILLTFALIILNINVSHAVTMNKLDLGTYNIVNASGLFTVDFDGLCSNCNSKAITACNNDGILESILSQPGNQTFTPSNFSYPIYTLSSGPRILVPKSSVNISCQYPTNVAGSYNFTVFVFYSNLFCSGTDIPLPNAFSPYYENNSVILTNSSICIAYDDFGFTNVYSRVLSVSPSLPIDLKNSCTGYEYCTNFTGVSASAYLNDSYVDFTGLGNNVYQLGAMGNFTVSASKHNINDDDFTINISNGVFDFTRATTGNLGIFRIPFKLSTPVSLNANTTLHVSLARDQNESEGNPWGAYLELNGFNSTGSASQITIKLSPTAFGTECYGQYMIANISDVGQTTLPFTINEIKEYNIRIKDVENLCPGYFGMSNLSSISVGFYTMNSYIDRLLITKIALNQTQQVVIPPTPPSGGGGGGRRDDFPVYCQAFGCRYVEPTPEDYIEDGYKKLNESFIFDKLSWYIIEPAGHKFISDHRIKNVRNSTIKLSFTYNKELSSSNTHDWVRFKFNTLEGEREFSDIGAVYLRPNTFFNPYKYIPFSIKSPPDADRKVYSIVYDVCDEYNYCVKMKYVFNAGEDSFFNNLSYWFRKYLFYWKFDYCLDASQEFNGSCSANNNRVLVLSLTRGTSLIILIPLLFLGNYIINFFKNSLDNRKRNITR